MRISGKAERWVRDAEEVAAFRTTTLSPSNVLKTLGDSGGKLLINVDTGVGKTTMVDGVVSQHRASSQYDLLLYVTSQQRVLRERPWVQEALALPLEERAFHDVAVLLGRPTQECGDLDERWRGYERAGCGQLARAHLCSVCPNSASCPWPEQLTRERLEGKRVVAATQAYLVEMPTFLSLLRERVGADRALVLIDEATILEARLQRELGYEVVRQSLEVFRAARSRWEGSSSCIQRWISLHERILDESADLARLPEPPRLEDEVAVHIQSAGLDRFGRQFRFLGHEMPLVTRSETWRSEDGGGVTYLRRPQFGGADYVVAAAGVPLELARHRLGDPRLVELAPGVRFLHACSKVYNLRSSLGSARNFEKNSPQIYFAVAQLIAKLAADGKRAIVVTKKRFVGHSIAGLERDLTHVTGTRYRVVRDAAGDDLEDPLVVPIISYGSQGVNTYESFDAAIALSSYNARDDVLEQQINDTHRPEQTVKLGRRVDVGGRVVGVRRYWEALQGFDDLAAAYQCQHESMVAEQALGRVRFAVRPRLVVFFQTGPIRFPAKEFRNLAEFREHFGLVTRREFDAARMTERVRYLDAAGHGAGEIAAQLGISERDVYRKLQRAADTNPVGRISLQASCQDPAAGA